MKKVKTVMEEMKLKIAYRVINNPKKAIAAALMITIMGVVLGISEFHNAQELNKKYTAHMQDYCRTNPNTTPLELCENLVEIVDPSKKEKCKELSSDQLEKLTCKMILSQK